MFPEPFASGLSSLGNGEGSAEPSLPVARVGDRVLFQSQKAELPLPVLSNGH